MENKILEAALNYYKMGFSVIPFKGKEPIARWKKYQKEKADETQIKKWFDNENPPNVGMVTGVISDLAVIDIDTDKGKETIQDYISDSLQIPTVNTPRGGQHLYFHCPYESLRGHKGRPPGCDFRANGNCVVAPPSVGSNGERYKWRVGLDTPKAWLPEPYLSYIRNNTHNCINRGNNMDIPEQMFVEGRRDEDLFHVANCLFKGKMPEHEVLQIIEKLALSCQPPFPLIEARIKVESAKRRFFAKGRNLANEVEEWVLSTNGHFLSTDVHKCLDLSTRQDRKNVSEILRRLIKQGVIEKWGNKDGCFRLVDTESPIIDWSSASVDTIDIKYPFGIEQYVHTMPKNIIVCAGSPNAGKTAFMLNIIAMNMHKFKINYFSSEMGAIELRNRLQKFDLPLSEWKFVAKERSNNFADVIKPEEINIIDFMELTEDFWKIGGMLKTIHDKLTTGIAIVALQKAPGATMGRGGVGSLEKPRLYLTMEAGHIKIEKGKNWTREDVNPNGLQCNFKLVQGCKFIQTAEWHRKEEL